MERDTFLKDLEALTPEDAKGLLLLKYPALIQERECRERLIAKMIKQEREFKDEIRFLRKTIDDASAQLQGCILGTYSHAIPEPYQRMSGA